MDNTQEYILCAAVHYEDHIPSEIEDEKPDNIESGFVLCGYRHINITMQAGKLLGIPSKKPIATQGFLTSRNRFVDREEAAQIAKATGQLIEPYDTYRPTLLHSEHIY